MTDEDLRDLFADFGEVASANVIMDKFSGQSKGFGFVEMPQQADAEAAIQALNDQDVKGRRIKVNQARPKEERAPRRRKF
jgi:RNA recognition motif-containing protein